MVIKINKVAIIGGGASGMFCALTASEFSNVKITVFEKMDRVGKKILATGNGRCNITNEIADKVDDNGDLIFYHGNNSGFAKKSFLNFNQHTLINYLTENGFLLRKEGNKYFPFSEQAGTVLEFLRNKCEKSGVEFLVNAPVNQIKFNGKTFDINGKTFDKVVVATGGQSSPHLGSDGSGYDLLSFFSHTRTKLFAAITQIKTDTTFVKQLKGIKIDAECTISVNNKNIKSEFGQVLFTDYGLSGPPIFQLSRIASTNFNKHCFIKLDFMPNYTFAEIITFIKININNAFKNEMTCENLLTLMLNKRVGQVIIKSIGLKLNLTVKSLKQKDIERIATTIKDFQLKVNGVKGFSNAQVTAGGMITDEFDETTLESKLQKGLYACGEILDIDGDCGGFNLQWAFSSGFAVGKAVAKND